MDGTGEIILEADVPPDHGAISDNVFRYLDVLPPESCRNAAFFTITDVKNHKLLGCSYRMPEAALREDTNYFLRLFMREDVAHAVIELLGTHNQRSSLALFHEKRHCGFTCFPTVIDSIATLLPEKSRLLACTLPIDLPTGRPDTIFDGPLKTYLAEDRPVNVRRPDDTFLLVAEKLFYPTRQLDGVGIEEGYRSSVLPMKPGANILGATILPGPRRETQTIEVSISPVQERYHNGMPLAPQLQRRGPESDVLGLF